MFTGIVEAIGTVQSIQGNRFTFSHPFGEVFEVGESIAVSGMCATVLESTSDAFTVEVIEESRKRTLFGNISERDPINLERSAVIGQRNSGHTVQGHIDEVGEILAIEKEGDYWRVRIGISSKNRLLIVQKGSIAVNGVSLTISNISNDQPCWFEVSLISHTWEQTTLHTLKKGQGVHIEYDVMGRYIVQCAKISL